MKMELLQPIPQRYKQLSGNTMKNYIQQTGQPGRNGQIPEHPHASKTQSGGNRKLEQTHKNKQTNKTDSDPWIHLTVELRLKQIWVQDQMASQRNSTRHLKQR